MHVTIREDESGDVLAEADEGPGGVVRYEGNWYFEAESVDAEHLRVTERTYTCPMKGTCNWVDAHIDGRTIKDVGWIYPEVKPGHEAIRGRYAFYAGSRGGTRQDE
jgi:uncharacterized protein (DUF427 family)